MTFIVKYRELKRLFRSYYNYLISADKALTIAEKKKLIKELSRINARMEYIEQMSFYEAGKICHHSSLQAPSRLNSNNK